MTNRTGAHYRGQRSFCRHSGTRWSVARNDPDQGSSLPRLRYLIGDGGHAGEKLRTVLAQCGQWILAPIRRSDMAADFAVLPKHWTAERPLAWHGCYRCLYIQSCAQIRAGCVFVAYS